MIRVLIDGCFVVVTGIEWTTVPHNSTGAHSNDSSNLIRLQLFITLAFLDNKCDLL